MFFTITFSYLVILIIPCVIYFLVPDTLKECTFCLTCMSACKPKRAKPKSAQTDDDDLSALSQSSIGKRLLKASVSAFELLFYPQYQEQRSPSSFSTSPTTSKQYLFEANAKAWLNRIEFILTEDVDNWLKVLKLKGELEEMEKLYSERLTAIQTKLITAQKKLQGYWYRHDGMGQSFSESDKQVLQTKDKQLRDWLDRVKQIRQFKV